MSVGVFWTRFSVELVLDIILVGSFARDHSVPLITISGTVNRSSVSCKDCGLPIFCSLKKFLKVALTSETLGENW